MEGFQIKTKILIVLLVAISFVRADETNASLKIDNNATMELIKAYVDEEKVTRNGKEVEKLVNPTKKDYLACKEQNSNSFLELFGVEALAIDDHHAITFSVPNEYKIYDPFYGFYVLYSDEPLPFTARASDLNCSKNLNLGSINSDTLNFGKFLSKGEVNTIDFKAPKGSMIITPCCEMVGISIGAKKYLPNEYLDFITQRKYPFNGYIGASFKEDINGVFVSNLDPFVKELLFCPDDEIVSINGEEITSKKQLEKIILSAKVGSTLNIVVRRGQDTHEVNPVVTAKPDYNLSAFAYLETLGISFSRDLTIREIEIDSFAQKSGLKIGDKLLQINFKNVKNLIEARNSILYSKEDNFHLLFTRNDFQFFVKFDRRNVEGGLIAIPYCPAI